jgi:hypothetical protein
MAEWCYVLFGALGSATILTAHDLLSPSVPPTALLILTVGGIAGTATLGLAELGSSLRLVEFQRIAGLTSAAFLLVLAWIAGVSLAGLLATSSPLPVAMGWLGVGSIGAGLLIVAVISRKPGAMSGQAAPDATATRYFLIPMVGIAAWMLWLATLA